MNKYTKEKADYPSSRKAILPLNRKNIADEMENVKQSCEMLWGISPEYQLDTAEAGANIILRLTDVWGVSDLACPQKMYTEYIQGGGTMLRKIVKPVSMILIVAFLVFSFTVQAARAGMIGTETAVHLAGKEKSRAVVTAFLERNDVRQAMTQQGVDVAEAQKRVAALSDAELAQIAQKIDQLPAGGDGVGAIVGAILLVFLVLLLTDILGLTHVYPFVNRR